MPAAGGGGAREGEGGGLWKRFPPFWASRNAVACGGRKKTIPFSRRKRVLPPSAITGARVEYAVVRRVRTAWRGEKTPSCSSSSACREGKINLVVCRFFLGERGNYSFLLRLEESMNGSLPLSIPRSTQGSSDCARIEERKLSRARGSLYKASLCAITFPPPSSLVHKEELNFMPERFIYRCLSASPPRSFDFVGEGIVRGNVRSSNEERKKGEGRKKNINHVVARI